MSDVELVISRCKTLEALLAERFNADGRGLHEKTTSAARHLSADTVGRLRFIATVRNKLVHEADQSRLDDRAGFLRACDAAERALRASKPATTSIKRRMAIAAAAFVVFAAIVLYVVLRG